MRYQSLVAFALSAASVKAQGEEKVTGELGDAVAVEDNPVGKSYVAKLPETPFSPIDVEGNVKGSVTATSGADGKGVDFKVQLSNLPKEGGPFSYHLHVAPVPEDGNCTETLAHLDPFIRGEDPPCDPDTPEACEVGDLSSKHGKADSDPFEATFNDPYASLVEGTGAFFGNRSLVVHFANKTRITCANFQEVTDGGEGGEGEDGCDEGSEGGGASPTGAIPTGGNDTASPEPSQPPPEGGSGGEDDIPIGAGAVSSVSLLGAVAAALFAL